MHQHNRDTTDLPRHNPALSYDLGAYMWATGDSYEDLVIFNKLWHADRKTAELAVTHIEACFERDHALGLV